MVLDLASKDVIGWAARPHMRTELVLEALQMATTARKPAPGLIVQADRGSQDTSNERLDALALVDAKTSMGRVGVAWDNAATESWFTGFKLELIYPIGAFTTRHEAVMEIARYIRWHNTTARHSAPSSAERFGTATTAPTASVDCLFV